MLFSNDNGKITRFKFILEGFLRVFRFVLNTNNFSPNETHDKQKMKYTHSSLYSSLIHRACRQLDVSHKIFFFWLPQGLENPLFKIYSFGFSFLVILVVFFENKCNLSGKFVKNRSFKEQSKFILFMKSAKNLGAHTPYYLGIPVALKMEE